MSEEIDEPEMQQFCSKFQSMIKAYILPCSEHMQEAFPNMAWEYTDWTDNEYINALKCQLMQVKFQQKKVQYYIRSKQDYDDNRYGCYEHNRPFNGLDIAVHISHYPQYLNLLGDMKLTISVIQTTNELLTIIFLPK